MGRIRLAFLIPLILLALPAAPSAAKEKVTWILPPAFPPARIADGPYAGRGIIDLQLDWLLKRLDGFDNVVVEVSNARGFHEIAAQDGQCAVDVLGTPERRRLAIFSRVAYAHMPPGLLVRGDRLRLLDSARTADGAVDLDRLARESGLSGVLARDRNFGPTISRFVAAGKVRLSDAPDVTHALMMMGGGRADYTFGYALEGRFYRRTVDAEARIAFLPIAGSPKALRAYIACSKRPIGEAVIRAVDELLERAGAPPPYMSEASPWFDADELRLIRDPANWRPDPDDDRR